MAGLKKFPWEDLLNEHPLFSTYDAEIRRRLIRDLLNDGVSAERHYAKNEIIIREGEIGENIYMIGSGSVRVVLLGENGEEVVTLFTFQKGDTFGEMALFDNKTRSATVIANGDCIVLKFIGGRFLEIIREYPELEFNILMRMSERLRHTDKQVLAVQRKNIDEKLQHFNTKLNAELKVIDASLKASQTVFEQTKMRTDEVISSAERSRSRLTFAASAIGVIISLFGFFGFKEYINVRDLSSTVKNMVAGVDQLRSTMQEKLVTVQEYSKEIEKVTDNIVSMEAQVNEIRKQLQTRAMELDLSIERSTEFIAEQVAIPKFQEALQDRSTGAALDAYEFLINLGLAPSFFQKQNYYLLMNVWGSMLNELGGDQLSGAGLAGEEKLPQMEFEPLLERFLKEAEDPHMAMVTHFLLLTNAAATGSNRFETYYLRFEKFMSEYNEKGLTEGELANALLMVKNKNGEAVKRFNRVKDLIPIE